MLFAIGRQGADIFWINGKPQTQLPVTDRALQFGDGFFTTARVQNGHIPLLSWHLERLEQAADRLLFEALDIARVHQEMLTAAAAAAAGGGDGVIKVIISRGSGGRGYSFQGCGAPLRILYRTAAPAHYPLWRREGVRLTLSPVRLARNPLLAGIKHLNRLEQVLIRTHLERDGGDEALVLDTDGHVVECCSANIFWRKGREVYTPDVSHAGVAGVMRRQVLTLLEALDYSVVVVTTDVNALESAEEVFITNALLPLVPVNAIGQRAYRDRTLYRELSAHC